MVENLWLGALPEASQAAILRVATRGEVGLREIVQPAHKPPTTTYFPIDAVFSIVVGMHDGKTAEAVMVGREGYAPVQIGLEAESNTTHTVVQVSGEALSIESSMFGQLARADEAIAALRDRYIAAVGAGLMQSVGCNALHTIRQRCARWLLSLADRTESHDIGVIHQVLAETLGASRPRVTEILATLQSDGLLELRRATLRIADPQGLRRAACECYGVIKTRLDSLSRPA